jgi:hypothetical protein
MARNKQARHTGIRVTNHIDGVPQPTVIYSMLTPQPAGTQRPVGWTAVSASTLSKWPTATYHTEFTKFLQLAGVPAAEQTALVQNSEYLNETGCALEVPQGEPVHVNYWQVRNPNDITVHIQLPAGITLTEHLMIEGSATHYDSGFPITQRVLLALPAGQNSASAAYEMEPENLSYVSFETFSPLDGSTVYGSPYTGPSNDIPTRYTLRYFETQ